MKKFLFYSFATLLVLTVVAFVFAAFSPFGGHPKVSARTAMAQLIHACDDYNEIYDILPLGSTNTEDAEILTTGNNPESLMNTLLSLESSDRENVKQASFFSFKAARENKTNGLLCTETTAELFDPWGNPYHVILDYDQDGKLQDPFSGKIKTSTRILIWSPGPDQKHGTKKTNKDNIYSWDR